MGIVAQFGPDYLERRSQLEFAIELYKGKTENKLSLRDICEHTGVSKATLCRRLRELGLTA